MFLWTVGLWLEAAGAGDAVPLALVDAVTDVCSTKGAARRDAEAAAQEALADVDDAVRRASGDADVRALEALAAGVSTGFRVAKEADVAGPCRDLLEPLVARNEAVRAALPEAKRWRGLLDDPALSVDRIWALIPSAPHGVSVLLSERAGELQRRIVETKALVDRARKPSSGDDVAAACAELRGVSVDPSLSASLSAAVSDGLRACARFDAEAATLTRLAFVPYSEDTFGASWRELGALASGSDWANHRAGAHAQLVDLLAANEGCEDFPDEPGVLGPGDRGSVAVHLYALGAVKEVEGYVPRGASVRVVRKCGERDDDGVPKVDWLIDQDGMMGVATAMAEPSPAVVRGMLFAGIEESVLECGDEGGVMDAEIRESGGRLTFRIDYWPEEDLVEQARFDASVGAVSSTSVGLDFELAKLSYCAAIALRAQLDPSSLEPEEPAMVEGTPPGMPLKDRPFSAAQVQALMAAGAAAPEHTEIRVRLLREVWSRDTFGNEVRLADKVDRSSSLVLGATRFVKNNWEGIAEVVDAGGSTAHRLEVWRRFVDGWSTW